MPQAGHQTNCGQANLASAVDEQSLQQLLVAGVKLAAEIGGAQQFHGCGTRFMAPRVEQRRKGLAKLRRLAEVAHERLVEVTRAKNRIWNRDEGRAIIIHAEGVS